MKNLLLLLITLFSITQYSYAQCHPATAEQKAAYDKVVYTLQQQFKTHMSSGGWEVFNEAHSLDNLELSDEFGRVFHLCGDRYNLTLERTTTAQTRRVRMATAAQADTLTSQPRSLVLSTDSVYREADADRTRQLAQSTVDIDVEMNAGNYRLEEPISNRFVSSYKVIKVDGVPLALQVQLKPDSRGDTPRPETVILLGNWKNNLSADSRSNKMYRYSFAKGGNLIENLVITIKGPVEVANEIVQNVNWRAIGNTLTK